MIIKKRKQAISHRILISLDNRMVLSAVEQAQLDTQEKGFEGECMFDEAIERIEASGLFICDLMLATRDTTYQIDALYISSSEVILYEIKNYTGQYAYKDGLMYSDSGFVLQDPLAQVKRKQSYIHNLLLKLNYSLNVTSYVVFIHSDFYIYSLPKTSQIIFSGQLPKHLASLSRKDSKRSHKSKMLAERLVAQHIDDFRPPNLPTYTFDQLKKGIYCAQCKSWNCSSSRQFFICNDCHYMEKGADAINRTLDEFHILFPQESLSLKTASLWCGPTCSDTRVRSVLKKHYHLHHSGRSSYYTRTNL